MLKIGIIKERKNPPDRRVVLSPDICQKTLQLYPELQISVESSDIRCFSDKEYKKISQLTVSQDVSDCDVLLGIKEIPVDALIPNKKYFFFSHTIKKQPYNRKLLQAILEKNIELYDHETITAQNNVRLIGFGYYAGLAGCYNAFRTYGIKYQLFDLPPVETLTDKVALVNELHDIQLPPLKIIVTGTGRVGNGVKEILDAMYIRQVSPQAFLDETFDEPVYAQIDVLDYNKRIDGQLKDIFDFFNHPEQYKSNFLRFAKVADILIAGHFHNRAAPDFFTKIDARQSNFNLRVIADISCDIDHPIPTTLRSSTISEPIYGYDRNTEQEGDFMNMENIAVMAVDNLPATLPRDASTGFGEMFLEHVIPAFFDGDKNGILQRAKITENGKLTERYSYLQDYVDGKDS